MIVTVESVLKAIETINSRKTLSIVFKRTLRSIPNAPIGIDSLAYVLKVKSDDVVPVVEEMIPYGVLEIAQQKTRRDGSMGIKLIRLKE